jgi:hypothetical protein
MSDPQRPSGGINFYGPVGRVGDVFTGNKTVGVPYAALNPNQPAQLDAALRPVLDAIKDAPSQVKPEAEAKVEELKREAAKGKDANHQVMTKLVDELIGLIPAAASAVGSAFATPVLGALVGPFTTYVLDKLRAK